MIGFAEGEQAIRNVVEGKPRRFETVSQSIEDSLHGQTASETMIAGHAVICATKSFVVLQIRKSTSFGSRADSLRKNSREEQRMVSDVDADLESCAIVGRSQRGEHLKEIIEWIILPGNNASGTFGTGKFSQNLSDIIGYRAVLDVSAAKDIAHQNVEVKPRGDAKTTATFEQRAKKRFVVKNEIARFFVSEEFYEAIGGFDFVAQNGENEVDIFGSELNSAVRLDDVHHRN